jgi:phosphatidylinositol-3,4,5-trisphosphate 3-phosphatase/dual-specificity protein phosphatase PTEN
MLTRVCWIRNHIEDVKTMMESQHGGHYTLYNLCERTYAASRFPSGQVVHAPLTQDSAPCLDTLLDLCSAILDYLSRNENQPHFVFC